MTLTDWQKQLLEWCRKGMGVDASPSQMTAKQRREADEMVAAGLIRKAKGCAWAKHGMYVKI